MRFLMGQEVGSGGADAKLYFRSPLLTRADYQPTTVVSATELPPVNVTERTSLARGRASSKSRKLALNFLLFQRL